MEKIVVQGGDNRLVGSVTIEGAKNAVLPLLAATILASEGKTVLQNVPILSDVFTMNQVVGGLNAKVDFNEEDAERWSGQDDARHERHDGRRRPARHGRRPRPDGLMMDGPIGWGSFAPRCILDDCLS